MKKESPPPPSPRHIHIPGKFYFKNKKEHEPLIHRVRNHKDLMLFPRQKSHSISGCVFPCKLH